MRLPNFRTVLVMMLFCHRAEIKKIYSPARGRTETFMKVRDSSITEKGTEACRRADTMFFTR